MEEILILIELHLFKEMRNSYNKKQQIHTTWVNIGKFPLSFIISRE